MNIKRINQGSFFEYFEIFAGDKSVVLRTNYNKRSNDVPVDGKLISGIIEVIHKQSRL